MVTEIQTGSGGVPDAGAGPLAGRRARRARRSSTKHPEGLRTAILVWACAILVGALLPPTMGIGPLRPGGPLAHLVAFSVLTLLLWEYLRSPWRGGALAWLYGVVIEGVQTFIPYRTTRGTDLVVNTVAVLSVIAVERVVQARAAWASTNCPRCGAPLVRIHRRPLDRIISRVVEVHRFRCRTSGCGWKGLRLGER